MPATLERAPRTAAGSRTTSTQLWEIANSLALYARRGAAPRRRRCFAKAPRLPRHLLSLARMLRRYWGPQRGNGGVLGVGVGIPFELGDEPTLRIYVRNRRFVHVFRGFPAIRLYADREASVIIQVVVTGVFRGQGRGKARPAFLGCSIGHPRQSGGTIGAVVSKTDAPNSRFILSATHVVAADNQGTKGDQVLQPAPRYQGGHGDAIGVLADFVPLRRSRTYADAGLVEPVDAGACLPEIWNLRVRPTASRMPDFDVQEPVWLSGVGTDGVVKGRLLDRVVAVWVRYNGFRWVEVWDFGLADLATKPGDSGDLVLGEDNKAIGLHSAYSSEGYALFSLFPQIERLLGVKLAI